MKQQDKDFGVQFAALTDKGQKKPGNEDRYYCATLWDDKHILAMAVDGVGGYAGGDIAARIAVEETVSYLERYRNGERTQLLAEAFVHANNTIFQQRFSEDRLYRMCCVMTVALFDLEKGCIYMAHVGDTRMYAHSGGRIIKLSHDHSPVGRDEEMGYLTELEAMDNPFRNIVDKAVGEQQLDNATDFVETNVFPMGNGITWMLCSDGLTDMITSANISLILDGNAELDAKAQELVDAANGAGGKDNITVVLVSSTASPDETTVQVMDEYARNVLPPRPVEDEPEITEEPETSEEPETPELSVEPIVSETEKIPESEPESIPEVESVSPPVHRQYSTPVAMQPLHSAPIGMPRRSFPWTPFLLFVITILLVATIALGLYSLMGMNDSEQLPPQGTQKVSTERLYYNINNL